tara:strand:+ start:773 stop:973 length:201 start_codon:yes stop_codon:yes gene_type:complete
MKDGDIFIDPDGRIGVVYCTIEACVPVGGGCTNAAMGFYFDNGEKMIIYEEEIEIIGGYSGAYILE